VIASLRTIHPALVPQKIVENYKNFFSTHAIYGVVGFG
jgi:hypothetical protein